ncbi:MAG: hypothetical protein QM715_07170 [Nibricoccus sp.]
MNNRIKTLARAVVSAALIPLAAISVQAADGYGRSATGGTGGANVTVTTAAQLKQYAESTTTYNITVSGTIDVNSTGTSVKVKSNKTIKGANTSATVKGCLDLGSGGVNNVIIQNLRITNPGGDGITLMGGCTNVFITKCEFFDCADGCCDIGDSANNITVSWCKFNYPSQADHRFTMILGRSTDPAGYLKVTLHHNWWASRCDQRMPSGSYGQGHLYNNYFNCSGNSYCTNARVGSNWLVQNSYYQSVKNPLYEEGGGKIKSSGNTFASCTGLINVATGAGFTLPYGYTLDATANVPTRVQGGAGNR